MSARGCQHCRGSGRIIRVWGSVPCAACCGKGFNYVPAGLPVKEGDDRP